MPSRWCLGHVGHFGHEHEADFSDTNQGRYCVHFGSFEDGLLLRLDTVRNADSEAVRDLLSDLDHVLRATDGVQSVEWFPESIFDSGCLIMGYQRLGASSPTDPICEVE
jgi:hypothetical protein